MHCLRLLSRMRGSTNINLKLRNMTEGEYQLVDDCRCRKRLSLDGAMERGEGARDGCFIHQHKPSARRLISFDWKRVEALPHTIQKQQCPGKLLESVGFPPYSALLLPSPLSSACHPHWNCLESAVSTLSGVQNRTWFILSWQMVAAIFNDFAQNQLTRFQSISQSVSQ